MAGSGHPTQAGLPAPRHPAHPGGTVPGRQPGWLGGQRSAVSCPVEIKRKQRRVKDPEASGMSRRIRQKAGVSSSPPSCPSLSCLQLLPLCMACTASSRSCPTSRAGAHPQDPHSCTRTPTPSKLLPEKGRTSKVEPGLAPNLLDAVLPALPRIPRAGEQDLSTAGGGAGCPSERAVCGAEAAGRCPGASLAAGCYWGSAHRAS